MQAENNVLKQRVIVNTVRSLMELRGYKPLGPEDKPRMGTVAVRVETHRFYCAGFPPPTIGYNGSRIIGLKAEHLTEEGLEELFRNNHEKDSKKNDVRWFVRKSVH